MSGDVAHFKLKKNKIYLLPEACHNMKYKDIEHNVANIILDRCCMLF